jgi:outer membrane protein OmpA-like peptidoglycan-associated protein
MKPILIIAGIIVVILIILLLLRNCDFSSAVKPEYSDPIVIFDPPPQVVIPASPEIIFNEKTEMLFVANSSDLLPSATVWLDEVAFELSKYIELNPNAAFQIIGYVAVVSGLPEPKKLSQERANKVVFEFIARNIKENKLQAVSGGETNRWGNNT